MAKKMKATTAMDIYTAGLILLFMMSMTVMISSTMSDETRTTDIFLSNAVYIMRDSLDSAKMYLDTSAKYSMAQAVYEMGKHGFLGKNDENVMEHDGKTYALWYDGDADVPKSAGVESLVNESFLMHFANYTNRNVISIYQVNLPSYSSAKLESVGGYGIDVSTKGDNPISMKRITAFDDEISLVSDYYVNITVYVPLHKLRDLSAETVDTLSAEMEDCTESRLEKTREEPCCTITSQVLNTSDGSCLVKVEAMTKDKYMVWDGENTIMDNIRLTFLMRQTAPSETESPASESS